MILYKHKTEPVYFQPAEHSIQKFNPYEDHTILKTVLNPYPKYFLLPNTYIEESLFIVDDNSGDLRK